MHNFLFTFDTRSFTWLYHFINLLKYLTYPKWIWSSTRECSRGHARLWCRYIPWLVPKSSWLWPGSWEWLCTWLSKHSTTCCWWHGAGRGRKWCPSHGECRLCGGWGLGQGAEFVSPGRGRLGVCCRGRSEVTEHILKVIHLLYTLQTTYWNLAIYKQGYPLGWDRLQTGISLRLRPIYILFYFWNFSTNPKIMIDNHCRY